MAAAAVDVGRVAGHLGLAQTTVQTVAAEPTAELVASLLRAVITKADEFDELYNSKLMVDVELESAHRNAEDRCRSAKTTADNALKEVDDVRQKLREEETTRQNIENELQSRKARNSDHDSEITTLRDRIESLQSSNRANMALLESRNARDSEVAEELAKQHQKNVQLNKEITSIQQSLQSAQATASSAKYREESLQQQLDLAKRNSDWFENELKTKNEENLKFRKEKGTRIAELQRQNDDAMSEVDALKRSEQQLRSRLDAAQTKAEDALTRIQQQQEAFARTEESYKHELDNKQRLVDMSNALTESHKTRVHQLETERDSLNQKHANDIKRLQQELEREKENCRAHEERVTQLEGEIDELQVRMEQQQAAPPAGSAPSTPRPNGSVLGRAASPFATPGSIRSKSAITATQAIDELYKVKGQLAGEKRRNAQLAEQLDEMISVLEAKTPEIEELQSEADSLRAEITKMSQLSQQSFEERDVAKKSARKAESSLSTSQAEAKILRSQLRDLSMQIQMLLFNMHAREKGVEQLTPEETQRIEQLSRGEVTEDALADMSDTHQFITQKFVVYKDVQELQDKNQELLRVTRELAEKMESEEAVAAKSQAVQDHESVERLQQELANMVDEAKSLKTTMESYKSERDMFRRLLQQKASAGELASILGSDVEGSQRAPLASIETDNEDGVSPQAALRDLQVQFDTYRDDAESIRQSLRDQVDKTSSEKNSLQGEIAKITSQMSLASERYDMLHSNFVALQNENKELQKRSQSLSETAAKQDIRTQQVVEELVEARGLVESMRNESANLKAEKELWKTIHDRLNSDNESLVQEKARLNGLLATQQSLQNERDIAESETRRKAQSKVDSLETELSDTKRKLSEEVEEGKKLQLRKEFDAKEAQKRIDELSGNLSQIREDQVALKTTRDHLQSRVDELTIELRSAEERYGRLQPRPTPRPGTVEAQPTQTDQNSDDEMRDLINEVADLKRDLELSNTHLENVKEQSEQYKQLSEQNEEALSEFTSSQEQFRQEMDAHIADKDAKIKELGQRVEDMSTELSSSNKELSNLRDAQGEVTRRFEDEKQILNEEITRLKDDVDRHSEAAKFHQADLRAQLDLTNQAQQDYEQELVKHAEAAKQAQQIRTQYNELKNELGTLKAEAEAAKVALAQSEGSWEDRRKQLEQEISELKARRDDANSQNKLLHQQLESITSQLSSLKQNRTSSGETVEAEGVLDSAADGLRELNSYLQREKDILEVQYDLKEQETKRLQQQLTYAQNQLEETRLKLDQERRSHADGSQVSLTHKDLMEKLNELNLYRESSATLRNELTQARAQITERNTKIEELEGKVQPLEAKIEELQTQKGFLEDEIKQIQEDRDRWQKRTEGILTKYGRVDPAEMEQLKQTITQLETERDTLKGTEETLKAEASEAKQTLEAKEAEWTSIRGRITEQFKARSKNLTAEKNQAIQEKKTLEDELIAAKAELEETKKNLSTANPEQVPELQQQLTTANEELQRVKQELQASASENTGYKEQIQGFQEKVQRLEQDAQSNQAQTQAPTESAMPASSDATAALEQQLADARKELDSIAEQKTAAEQELENLRSQLQTAVSERDEAVQKAQEVAQQQPAQEAAEANAAQTLAPSAAASSGLTDEERKALEEKASAAEAKVAELEAKLEEVENTMSQTVKERSDKMRNKLNDTLRQEKAKLKEEMEEELQTKLEQEKVIWKAENAPAAAAPQEVEEKPPAPTPSKQQVEQPPGTPTSGTPTSSTDLSQLPDAEVRKLLATNPTAKSIFTANLKKRLEEQTSKSEATLKAEYEQKVTTARDEGSMLASKKSALQITMKDNQIRAANAKIEVVSTAAGQTPERAVGEVWEEAKAAKPAPAPAPQQQTPARAPSNAAATPAQAPSTPAPAAAAAKPAPATPATESKPAQATPAAQQPAGTETATEGQQATASNATPNKNPFAASTSTPNNANNPFAQAQQQQQQQQPQAQAQAQGQGQTPTQKPQQQQQNHQQQGQQGQQPQRSGIPLPGRGGGRGRGGPYQPPGNRAGSGQHGERGGHAGRGRGRGGGNLNPSAGDFQPGNKRPRPDSEGGGGGSKRPRGNH